MDYVKLWSMVEELKKYAELEGAEIGELCYHLCELSRYMDYVSDEFETALHKEIEVQLRNFKENATIVERPETFTQIVTELEWKS